MKFYWKKILDLHLPKLEGNSVHNQLSISIEGYDIESMNNLIEEVEQVLTGNLVQTDFSSGELSDFVEVYKEESRLYPVFEEDDHLKISTKDLLEILRQWRDFISNPPDSKIGAIK
ncbi:hypothetical protein [Aquimarina algiphila]|uniref:hypothetical protein n=1 Tax=Aquimarina algiphila TaxID=2047982 RepID=UPI00232E4D5D|nr:hypothetical protein [Aquimarina algiphila]